MRERERERERESEQERERERGRVGERERSISVVQFYSWGLGIFGVGKWIFFGCHIGNFSDPKMKRKTQRPRDPEAQRPRDPKARGQAFLWYSSMLGD